MILYTGRYINGFLLETGHYQSGAVTEVGDSTGGTADLTYESGMFSGGLSSFGSAGINYTYYIGWEDQSNTPSTIDALYLSDDYIVKSEDNLLIRNALLSVPTQEPVTAISISEDGYAWSYGSTEGKYLYPDNLKPLCSLQSILPVGITFENVTADLYMLPLGYLSATPELAIIGAVDANLIFKMVLEGEGVLFPTIGNGYAEFVASWYTTNVLGYIYRSPYKDALVLENSETCKFDNLLEKEKDIFKSLPLGLMQVMSTLSSYSWNKLDVMDFLSLVEFDPFWVMDRYVGQAWEKPFPYDAYHINGWDTFTEFGNFNDIGFKGLVPFQDHMNAIPWGTMTFFDRERSIPWRTPNELKVLFNVKVGGEICYLVPSVVKTLPDGSNLTLDMVIPFPKVIIPQASMYQGMSNTGRYISGNLTENGLFLSGGMTDTGNTVLGGGRKEIVPSESYPVMDRTFALASSVYVSDSGTLFIHDAIKNTMHLPLPQGMNASETLWVSATGSHWENSGIVSYYTPQSPGVDKVAPALNAGIHINLTELLSSIKLVKSAGCYERTTDHYTNPIKPPIILAPKLPLIIDRSFITMSTATLIRISDSTLIPVTSMSLTTDIDSWGWSFSASLRTSIALDNCKPVNGEPVALRATINEHSWDILIDGYDERGSFRKTDYTIKGRSRGAELIAPMATIGTYTYDTAMTLAALLDAELARINGLYLTNWVGVWDAACASDVMPANTFGYQDKTPMENIQALASAVGAFVWHERTTRTLHISPKYKKNPWNYGTVALLEPLDEDYTISGTALVSTGMTWEPRQVRDAIFVSGTTAGGYLCKVRRAESAGTLIIPMVTDPLISTSSVALARGGYEIRNTGKKGNYSIETLLLPPGSALPLLVPGNVIKYQVGTETWWGLLKGNSVGVSIAGQTVIVRQQTAVERHFE